MSLIIKKQTKIALDRAAGQWFDWFFPNH
jgi:hypothetical protein